MWYCDSCFPPENYLWLILFKFRLIFKNFFKLTFDFKRKIRKNNNYLFKKDTREYLRLEIKQKLNIYSLCFGYIILNVICKTFCFVPHFAITLKYQNWSNELKRKEIPRKVKKYYIANKKIGRSELLLSAVWKFRNYYFFVLF